MVLRQPLRNNNEDSSYVIKWRELVTTALNSTYQWRQFTPVWSSGGSMIFTPNSGGNVGLWRYKTETTIEVWVHTVGTTGGVASNSISILLPQVTTVNNNNVLTADKFFAGIEDGSGTYVGHVEVGVSTAVFYKTGKAVFALASGVLINSTFHYRIK